MNLATATSSEFTAGLEECPGAALSGIMVGVVVDGAFTPSLRVGPSADAYIEVYATASGGRPPLVTFSIDTQAPIAARVAAT